MAFFLSLWYGFKEIFKVPFTSHNSALWWQLVPIILLWFILEIYFDSHKHEKLGWNTALGNSISLFWISLAATQPLFRVTIGEHFSWSRFLAIVPILLYALFTGYISFTHKFTPQVIYSLAYPTIIYYLATFAILWGNSALEVNRYVLIAFFLLFFIVYGVRYLFFWLLPDSKSDDLSS